MSGYTPMFDSLYQGSLCGQWPALAVFCTILPLADKNGEIDYSFTYLATVTGWPEDLLRKGIEQLEQPDHHSRSPDDDGRRLVKIRPNTEWGWRVVNHSKYREKARLVAQNAAQVSDGRNAEKCRRYREKKARHPATPGDTLSNANANTNIEREKSPNGSRIPVDWEPSMVGLSVPQDFSVEGESEKFRDYWTAATRNATKRDWQATWRNWVRRSVEGGTYSRRGTGGIKWQ